MYLPDELATQAKTAGLNLSAVTREAVQQRLAGRSTDVWLDSLATARQVGTVSHGPGAEGAISHDAALAALDAARDAQPTRHG